MSTVVVNLTDADPSNDLDALARERDWSQDEVVFKPTNVNGPNEKANPPTQPPNTSVNTGVTTLTIASGSTFDVIQVRRKGVHSKPIIWSTTPALPQAIDENNPVNLQLAARARISCWLSAGDLGMARKPTTADPSRIVPTWRSATFPGLDDLTLVATVLPKLPTPGGMTTEDFDWAPNFVGQSTDSPALFLSELITLLHKQKVQVWASIFMDMGVGTNVPFANGFVKYIRDKAKKTTGTGFETSVAVLTPRFTTFAQNLVAFFDNQPTGALDIDGISIDLETTGASVMGAAERPAVEAMFNAIATELNKKGRYLAYASRAWSTTNPPSGFMSEQPYDLALNPNIIARPMSYCGARDSVKQFALGTVKLHPGQLQVGQATVRTQCGVKADNTPNFIVPDTMDSIKIECDKHRKQRVGVIHWNLGTPADALKYKDWNDKLNPNLPMPGTLGQPLQGPMNDDRITAMKNAGATFP